MKKNLQNSLKILVATFLVSLISNFAFAQTNQPISNRIQEINKILQQSQESIKQISNINKEKIEKENREVQPLEEKNTPIAKKILQQTNSIVRIQVQSKLGKEKFSMGSGAFLTLDGLIVTNYHVISSHFTDPLNTTVIFNIGKSYEEYEAQLESVDLVNDLALIRPVKSIEAKPITIGFDELQRGDKLYSVGFPHNWSMTMIDGIYNGYMEKQIVPHYLVSQALSSGMSGGPTFSEDGKLVAINVAATNKLSILIPVQSALQLINNYSKEQLSEDKKSYIQKVKSIREKAIQRYSVFSEKLLGEVIKSQPIKIGAFSLPFKNSLFECWSKQSNADSQVNLDIIKIMPKKELIQTQRSCSTQDNIFLQDNNTISQILFNTYHYEQPLGTNPLVLWKTIEKKFNLIALGNEYSIKAYSGVCFYKNVTNQKNNLQKMQICLAPLKETNKLWQVQISQILYDNLNQAIIVDSFFDGFTEKSINQIISHMKKI